MSPLGIIRDTTEETKGLNVLDFLGWHCVILILHKFSADCVKKKKHHGDQSGLHVWKTGSKTRVRD